MKSSHFYHDPNAHYAIQDTPLPFDSSLFKRKFLDIPYATLSSSQKLDIYLPDEGDGPFPVIVAIHGGAFLGWDKGDMQVAPMLKGLKDGFAVVAINYRLSDEAKFPAQVHDVKTAVRWIRGNAEKYYFDPQKIIAWGGSAGGYLASMLAVSAGVIDLEDLSTGYQNQSSCVQAAVVWYGPINFIKMEQQLEQNGFPPPPDQFHCGLNSPESLLLGDRLTKIPELVQKANPETYITPVVPHMLIQHGNSDTVVPLQQSLVFFEKLHKIAPNSKIVFEIIENAVHLDTAFESNENTERIFQFIKTVLK